MSFTQLLCNALDWIQLFLSNCPAMHWTEFNCLSRYCPAVQYTEFSCLTIRFVSYPIHSARSDICFTPRVTLKIPGRAVWTSKEEITSQNILSGTGVGKKTTVSGNIVSSAVGNGGTICTDTNKTHRVEVGLL